MKEHQILYWPAVFEVVEIGECLYGLEAVGEFHSRINDSCNLLFYLRLPTHYGLAGYGIYCYLSAFSPLSSRTAATVQW